LKFVKDLLKRKQKLDPTQPETLDSAAVPEEKKSFVGGISEYIGGLKDKVFTRKPKAAEPAAAEPQAEPEEMKESVGSLEDLKAKLGAMMSKKNSNHKRNTIIIVAGAGLAVAGMAADVMFLGGMATATVVGIIYSDLRNAQHIKKISDELSKIDEKIETLKGSNEPLPDYAPALKAVKSSIEDFQASAKKVPPEVAEDLERLKKQVAALQDKIEPANDDRAPKKAAPGGPAP
jgi:Zn-dependent oligopeptidase